MKRVLSVLALALAGFATQASAQPLMTYNYVDAAYQWTYIDDTDINNANGVDANFSVSPISNFAIEGGYNYLDTKAYGLGYNQDTYSYGGAGWYSLCDGLDLVAHVGGLHARGHLDEVGSVSDNGMYAGGTVRYLATEDLETDLDIAWDRIDTGNWTYGATALYAVHKYVALKGSAQINKDSDVALLAGIRLAM